MKLDVSVTKYIYCYKNKKAGVFYVPFVLDDDPELTEKKLIRTVDIDPEAAKNLRHLELYLLGTMTDTTGDIVPNKQFIIDIDDVLADIKAAGLEGEVGTNDK